MNKVILIGRLTADPELRRTGNDTPVATFTLAINRPSTKEEKDADFINVVAWEKYAENVKKYLVKGSQVAVEGRIQNRTYEDKDNNTHYVTEVIANNVEFLGSKKESE